MPKVRALWTESWRSYLRGLIIVGLMIWIHSRVSNNITFWALVFKTEAGDVRWQEFGDLAWAEELLLNLAVLPAIIGFLLDKPRLVRWGFWLVLGLLTLSIAGSITQIVATLLYRQGNRGAVDLIWDASLIWLQQLGLFALWYWQLDSGGPTARTGKITADADFIFPQQQQNEYSFWHDWRPNIIDYLFVSFCASLTYGPTDTQVLSRRAKTLKMVQAIGSFILITVVMARAIGILTS